MATDCEWCGKPIPYKGRGRHPKYCSPNHRQYAHQRRIREAAKQSSPQPPETTPTNTTNSWETTETRLRHVTQLGYIPEEDLRKPTVIAQTVEQLAALITQALTALPSPTTENDLSLARCAIASEAAWAVRSANNDRGTRSTNTLLAHRGQLIAAATALVDPPDLVPENPRLPIIVPPPGCPLESGVFRSETSQHHTRLYWTPDNTDSTELLGQYPVITAPVRGYKHGPSTPRGRLAADVVAATTGYRGHGLPKPLTIGASSLSADLFATYPTDWRIHSDDVLEWLTRRRFTRPQISVT